MKKNIVKFTSLILCCLILTSCSRVEVYPDPLPIEIQTPPEPSEEDTYFDATLFVYSSTDYYTFEETSVRLPLDGYKSRAHIAVETLLEIDPIYHNGYMDLSLDYTEIIGNVLLVYLVGEVPEDRRDFVVVRGAIASTAAANQEEITHTILLVNGIQPGYNGRPISPLAPLSQSLLQHLSEMDATYNPELYSPLLREEDDEATSVEALAYEQWEAMLCFPDTSGNHITNELADIRYEKDLPVNEIASYVLHALAVGPTRNSEFASPFPSSFPLLHCYDIQMIDESGSPLEPDEDGVLPDGPYHLALFAHNEGEGLLDARLYAATAYSLLTFLPEISGLRIYLGEEPLTPSYLLMSTENKVHFELSDFDDYPGMPLTFFVPDKSNSLLNPVTYFVPSEDAFSPMARLFTLLSDSLQAFPYTGISAEDILSVEIADDIAIINWRAGFKKKIERAIERESIEKANARERMIIYAIVNTLCEIDGIERVWMLEEGHAISGAAGMIDLSGPLLNNPGLVALP